MRPVYLLLTPLVLLLTACGVGDDAALPTGFTGEVTPTIQLNQVGFYPDQEVTFTLADPSGRVPVLNAAPASPPRYYVTNAAGDTVRHEGFLGAAVDWSALAGLTAKPTTVGTLPPGNYRIFVPHRGYSATFRVADNVLERAKYASIKALYYQRASQALPERYAGRWHRAAGHPDTAVAYHPSTGRTAGTRASPGGWYDAGDFNKYVLNGSFPLGQYLALYEDVGDPAPDGSLNLPESGNGRSDYLDELRYELDWLLTMQDDDGGLFHKLTAARFEPMVLPEAATSPRYLVGKSTTATLNFAAATAQAARVYRADDPAYADRLLVAARRAWRWGLAHPDRMFRNPEGISTGEYGDDDATDERAWAAAELFATTGEQEYLNALQAAPPRIRFGAGEGWRGYMANLAAFTLLRFPDRVPQEFHLDLQGLVETLADSLAQATHTMAYQQPIEDFRWGSNSDVLNAALLMAAADLHTPKPAYRAAILRCVNYLFGNNPNGVCYLTGFGHRYPRNIHHRQSFADDVAEPVPGLLAGGPNAQRQDQDKVTYPNSDAPLRSWTDETASYASNEICLNWNAPLTYVLGYLEARSSD